MDWQNFPEWLRYALVAALPGVILGTLSVLFRDALINLLRRLFSCLERLLGERWADRRFERRYLKWIAGECEKVSLIGVLPARPGREPRLSEVFISPTFPNIAGSGGPSPGKRSSVRSLQGKRNG